MSDYKIGIGIANTGSIHIDTTFCLLRMLKGFPYDYDVILKRGSILHYNREEIVKTAIKNGCTHLLFLDTDMTFGKDAVQRLLERKKDIIGVRTFTKKEPSLPIAFLEEGQTGDLQRAISVGTGFMLIDLKVFEKIKEPWFFWKTNDKGEVLEGEDYWFCRRAKEEGFQVWCDLSVPIGHIGDKIY